MHARLRDACWLSACWLSWVGAFVPSARAQPAASARPEAPETVLSVEAASDVVLSVEAPPEADCTSADELWREVAARIDASEPPTRAEAPRKIRVQIGAAERGHGHVAQLTLVAADGTRLGERRLTSAAERCSELDEALVLVITTLVGVARAESAAASPPAAPLEPPPAPPDESRAEATAEASDPPASEPARPAVQRLRKEPRASPWRLNGSVAGTLGSGLLPFAAGLSGALVVEHPALRIALGSDVIPRVSDNLGGGAQARFAAVLARAIACPRAAELSYGSLSVCGGARAGVMLSSTSGLAQERRSQVPAAELDFGLRFDGELGQKRGWYGALSATLPLYIARFYYDDTDGQQRQYHQVSAGFLAELGLMFRSPL